MLFDIDNRLHLIYNKDAAFSIHKSTYFMDKTPTVYVDEVGGMGCF